VGVVGHTVPVVARFHGMPVFPHHGGYKCIVISHPR